MSFVRVLPHTWEAPAALPPLPAGTRPPFGWTLTGLGPAVPGGGSALFLRFPDTARQYIGRAAHLRLTTALASPGEHGIVLFSLRRPEEAVHPLSHPLAYADASDLGPLQTIEITLDASAVEEILQEGLILRQTQGFSPLFLLTETAPDATALCPHLLFEDPLPKEEEDTPASLLKRLLRPRSHQPVQQNEDYRLTAFLERILSPMDLAQPFGPGVGYVLDGLIDLIGVFGEAQIIPARNRYLKAYFDRDRLVVRESSTSLPNDSRLYTIEESLPFAALARTDRAHPALRLILAFWDARTSVLDSGLILDNRTVTASGSYTVAYTMAVLAATLRHPDLEEKAIRQFLLRRNRLQNTYAFFGQTDSSGMGDQATQNAADALGFYLLGMARALPFLSNARAAAEIGTALQEGCLHALQHRREDGLWYAQIAIPRRSPDIIGSISLAAALARAEALGYAPSEAREAALVTFQTLTRLLTPDGFFLGLPAYALGLFAQLAAALPRSILPVLPDPPTCEEEHR